jgi:hypothetical protein
LNLFTETNPRDNDKPLNNNNTKSKRCAIVGVLNHLYAFLLVESNSKIPHQIRKLEKRTKSGRAMAFKLNNTDLSQISPTDDRFIEAISSLEPVAPPTKEELLEIKSKDDEANTAFHENNFVLAQSLANIAKKIDVAAKKKQQEFDVVEKCAFDALNCMEAAKAERNFLKAGEWKLLYDKLVLRLPADHCKLHPRLIKTVEQRTDTGSKKRGLVCS